MRPASAFPVQGKLILEPALLEDWPPMLNSRYRQQTLAGLAFVSPWLIGLALLFAYPFVASLVWSFCRYDLLSAPSFVGLEHYQRLAREIIQGDHFGQALWNTAYYALLSVPLSILVAMGLAIMLSWNIRGQAFFRTLFFLPSVVPLVAAAILWMWLLDPRDGPLHQLLMLAGLPRQLWFQGAQEAAYPATFLQFGSKDALVLMSLWGVGNFMIIYLAALGDIPRSLHESAALDGAGSLSRFRHITLPMLTPIIFFNLVLGLIQSVQEFTRIYLVSEGTGEPVGSTLLLSLHLFLAAFQDLEMGYASAMAWILFVVLALATYLLFRSSRHWVHYQEQLR
ncbi:MAG: sugar ABC transporter permease [Planctomycetota bacterium]|nr:sugar ABC transporter permease [Planctomycetota bacterium]